MMPTAAQTEFASLVLQVKREVFKMTRRYQNLEVWKRKRQVAEAAGLPKPKAPRIRNRQPKKTTEQQPSKTKKAISKAPKHQDSSKPKQKNVPKKQPAKGKGKK